MNKTYSESELKEIANGVFEQFPNATKVHATSDGNVFLEKNRAELHAGPKGRVYHIEKNPAKSVAQKLVDTLNRLAPLGQGNAEEKTYPLNAKNTIAAIKAVEKIEDLEQYKTDERTSVIAALTEKTNQLTEPAE